MMKYIFVFLVLYSCNSKLDRNAHENENTSSLDSKISEKEASICEICPKDAFMVETLDSNQNVPLTFNEPIVLEFLTYTTQSKNMIRSLNKTHCQKNSKKIHIGKKFMRQ